jgi:hypothetical protein
MGVDVTVVTVSLAAAEESSDLMGVEVTVEGVDGLDGGFWERGRRFFPCVCNICEQVAVCGQRGGTVRFLHLAHTPPTACVTKWPLNFLFLCCYCYCRER